MSYRNLMEDVIKTITNEVINNDKDIMRSNINTDEIVAYVLNRTPAKYITSERGILHGKLDVKYSTQQKTDILLLIYEAIDLFKNRRPASSELEEDAPSEIRLPHIMGEVLEETTFSVIPGVNVSLLFNNQPIKMLDPLWNNPYTTNKTTKGYFHFWPKYDSHTMGDKNVHFTLHLHHPNCEEKTVEIEIDVLDTEDKSNSVILPIILMNIKEGIDLDFLYE